MPWQFWIVPVMLLLIAIPSVLRSRRKRRAERAGKILIGTVRDIAATGSYVGKQPELRLTLDLNNAAGDGGQTTLKQVFPVTFTPQVGQQIAVVVNPDKPSEAFLADETALKRDDRTAEVLRAVSAVPPSMAKNPPQVGDIVAITPVGDGSDSYQVSVVRLGQQPSPVFCKQTFAEGHPYAVGDRVYLVTDAQVPPRTGYILPPSFSAGQRIPNTGNKCDSIVLADALLFSGAKASGRVLAARELPLAAAYQSHGASKWSVDVHVTPEDGSTGYDGTFSVAVSTPEKAAAISQFGATLPLRYDPNDKPTFTLDSIALGWGDPALARQQMKKAAAAERAT